MKEYIERYDDIIIYRIWETVLCCNYNNPGLSISINKEKMNNPSLDNSINNTTCVFYCFLPPEMKGQHNKNLSQLTSIQTRTLIATSADTAAYRRPFNQTQDGM